MLNLLSGVSVKHSTMLQKKCVVTAETANLNSAHFERTRAMGELVEFVVICFKTVAVSVMRDLQAGPLCAAV